MRPPAILDRVFSGATPLIGAACYGRLDACRLLVERKADLTARDRCPQITRALLMRGRPHALRCSDGTALDNAFRHERADVEAYLCSIGAK